MSAKINVQQKVDKKIYASFRGELMKKGIPIQKGLEMAMALYVEKSENGENKEE